MEHGITHAAIESTGVYWKPVYHILSTSSVYHELEADHVNLRAKAKRKSYLRKELEKLGHKVRLTDSKTVKTE
ncbi:MAG: IS110 family transposase [Prevotellaceae bacterium]|nr:IS110 family transposase [Prevotellaceae bacterium]